MDALIPLLLIFIAVNSKQLSKDKLYRANVFAVVGFLYFVFLQYIYYWIRIFQVEGWLQFIPLLVAVLVAIGVCLSPWNKRSSVVKTISMCSIFVVSLVTTYIADVSIKEWLAERGGFYKARLASSLGEGVESDGEMFEFYSVGVEMKALSGWRKSELSSGHEYLVYQAAGERHAEVRPNCLGKLQVDIPTYLSRVLHSIESGRENVSSSYECGQYDGLRKCLVKATYLEDESARERWHWFTEKSDGTGVVVDFILSADSELRKEEAAEIMKSTRLVDRRTAEMCRTPSAWL